MILSDGWMDIPPDLLDADRIIRLDDLKRKIEDLQLKYGKYAVIGFDAGHNNVCAMIKPTKKVIVKKPKVKIYQEE